MIISHKHKFVFIHIPKCAGTSVREKLLALDQSAENYWDWEWDYVLNRYVDRSHMPLLDIVHNYKIKKCLDEYYVFTVIRNPYDRFFSAVMEHKKQHPEAVELSIDQIIQNLDPTNIRYNASYVHFCPMHYFTHIGNKKIVDEIIQIDNLEYGIAKVCSILHVPYSDVWPIHWSNKRNSVNEDVGPKKIYGLKESEKFHQLYERDFMLFDVKSDVKTRLLLSDSRYPIDNIDLNYSIGGWGNPERFSLVLEMVSRIKKLERSVSDLDATYTALKRRTKYYIRIKNLIKKCFLR